MNRRRQCLKIDELRENFFLNKIEIIIYNRKGNGVE